MKQVLSSARLLCYNIYKVQGQVLLLSVQIVESDRFSPLRRDIEKQEKECILWMRSC